MKNFIKIHHPDLPGSDTSVHPKAFEEVHKEKGWVEGEAETSPSPQRESRKSPPRTSESYTTPTMKTDPEED